MTFYEGKLFRDENGKVYFNDLDGEGFTDISEGPTQVGTIVSAIANPNPNKYLKLDNSWVARTSYPALSALVSTTPHWEMFNLPDQTTLFTCVAHNGSRIVAGNQTTCQNFYISDNFGRTWYYSNTFDTSTRIISQILWTGYTWIAIAQATVPWVLRSTDGVTWTKSAITSATYTAIGYNGHTIIALSGTNGQISADDGATWSPFTAIGNYSWRRVVYGNGVWCSVPGTNAASAMRSVDGVNWTSITMAYEGNLTYVAWDGTRFVATADSNNIQVSPDATSGSWTLESVTPIPSSPINSHGNKLALGLPSSMAIGTHGNWVSTPAPWWSYWNGAQRNTTYSDGKLLVALPDQNALPSSSTPYGCVLLDQTTHICLRSPSNAGAGNWYIAAE
jgi:hypothetical protein